MEMEDDYIGKPSYEQSRERRIQENRERMEKLGIVNLSLNLKSQMLHNQRRTLKKKSDPALTPNPSQPLRRSSRLQNVTPVSYSDVHLQRDGVLEAESALTEAGSKPEFYTVEHERLLGSTDKCWTLFVDGYGKDGKRIYDPFKGKTCHQCRQKTLGYRTQCSKCNMVQGQFCGDCLYMRYGEHVLEALENPNWKCPVCRGICNCSLCRQAKGWPPTGSLYKRISALGYKSVAHYLIQTRRSDISAAKCASASNQVSAKRSLPFSDAGELPMESVEVINHDLEPGSSIPLCESNGDNKLKAMQTKHDQGPSNRVSARRALPFPDTEAHDVPYQLGSLDSQPGVESCESDHKMHLENKRQLGSNDTNESCTDFKKIDFPTETYAESNGYNCAEGNIYGNELQRASEKADGTCIISETIVQRGKKCESEDNAVEAGAKVKKKAFLSPKTVADSVAGRIKRRRRLADGQA